MGKNVHCLVLLEYLIYEEKSQKPRLNQAAFCQHD